MVSTSISHLEDIASIADEFLSVLRERLPRTHDNMTQEPTQITPLRLPDVDSQSLQQAISQRFLSRSSAISLVQLYEMRATELRSLVLSSWQQLAGSMPRKESIAAIQEASKGHYRKSMTHLQESLLMIVDDRIRVYNRDAEASAQSEFDSSSEDGIVIPRGHSRLAVKILEKAYERTTNISRAEKIRLAAATKLEPRQVTIWFQNRRNRKVAAAAPKPLLESRLLTPTSSTPTDGSRKRKAGGLYDGEIRQPFQRLRTTTPDNLTRHVYLTSTSSTSSMGSSIDSLASFCRGVNGKDRNYSTDSSEFDTFDSAYSKTGLLNGLTSFDDQINYQAKRLPAIVVKSEEDASSSLIFSDTGITQLDFDDLGLDLNSLADDLPSLDMGDLDFGPLSLISNQPPAVHNDINKTPKQPTFAVPSVPTSMYDTATALNEFFVDAEEEWKRAQLIEEWAFGMGLLLEKTQGDDDELYLNLDGLRTRAKNSPNSDSISTDGSSTNVATPQDLFDFSLEGLCLDKIMNDRLESYQDLDFESVPHQRPQDLSIDVEAANMYHIHDALATARQEISVR